MNQIELSKKLGVTQSYISKYLRGERGCSLQTARKLTEFFGCNPLFWLEATPEQKHAILGNGGNGRDKKISNKEG
ncbi:MAG: helix-turn-helix transcriptional regulator [Desulfobacteraceae bacterium]|nr:helix-turn-helix transcriptional regulator [Desulfobacteraceae bacterium]